MRTQAISNNIAIMFTNVAMHLFGGLRGNANMANKKYLRQEMIGVGVGTQR